MKKQNLWFLTLFSLILVLGVYYITMPNDLLEKIEETTEKKEKAVIEEVQEESPLVAMRVSLEESRQEEMNVLQEQLTKEELSKEEKNNVYEKIKTLKEVQGKEEQLEKKIKKNYGIDCFIKIENNNITAICISDEHDTTLANHIMRLIQENYKERKNTTIKFQKK